MILATDPLSKGPIPPDGSITFRFELSLLAHALAETPMPTRGQGLVQRILDCLPTDPRCALTPAQVGKLLPDAAGRTVSSYVCALAKSGRAQRVGQPGHQRYYRQP